MIFDSSFKSKFCTDVMNHVKEKKETYLDSIIYMCEKYEIDPEIAAKFLSKPIIEKLQVEGQNLHLLKTKKKSKKLPF